jgi:hypothetical protein
MPRSQGFAAFTTRVEEGIDGNGLHNGYKSVLRKWCSMTMMLRYGYRPKLVG